MDSADQGERNNNSTNIHVHQVLYIYCTTLHKRSDTRKMESVIPPSRVAQMKMEVYGPSMISTGHQEQS